MSRVPDMIPNQSARLKVLDETKTPFFSTASRAFAIRNLVQVLDAAPEGPYARPPRRGADTIAKRVRGQTTGLKRSDLSALERVYRRQVPTDQIVSFELAETLAQISRSIRRQIGVLIDRRGRIAHVICGDDHRLFLPELGRHRAGRARLRGLRLVHTHLFGERLSRDDLTDLSLLHLDLVAAQADAAAETGNTRGIAFAVFLAILRTFLVNATAAAVTTAAVSFLLVEIRGQLGPDPIEALGIIGIYLIPALGLAVSLSMLRQRRALILAAITFVVVSAIISQGQLL